MSESNHSNLSNAPAVPVAVSPWPVAGWLFAGVLAAYLLVAPHYGPMRGDAGEMMRVARHLGGALLGQAAAVPDGERFSKYGLGQSLLDLSVAWTLPWGESLGTQPARLYTCLVAGLLPAATQSAAVALVYLILLGQGTRPRLALGGALALAVGTMHPVYAQLPWAEPTLGVCWLLAVYALLRYQASAALGWLAVLGAAAGFAVLTKVAAVLAVPVLLAGAGVLVARQPSAQRPRALLALAGPLLLMAGLWLWWNYWRYGGWLRTGYHDDRDASMGFNTPWFTGLLGLLLSPGKGLLWYNPLLLLSLWAWPAWHRRQTLLSWLVLGLAGGQLLIHAPWWAWHGDWSWGPRFLVSVLPLLVLPAGDALARLWPAVVGPVPSRRRLGQGLALGLILLGAAVQVPALLLDYAPYIRLVTGQVRGLSAAFYEPREWPIRDDGVMHHFIPELSPLLGQAWLLRQALTPPGPERERLHATPPWHGLHPGWQPAPLPADALRWAPWWLVGGQLRPPLPYGHAVAGLLALISLGSLVLAWRRGRQS